MVSVHSSKNFGVRRIPRLGTGGLEMNLGHVTHQSIGNFVWIKKIYTFICQKETQKRNLGSKISMVV
jgi:hypothetical protein